MKKKDDRGGRDESAGKNDKDGQKRRKYVVPALIAYGVLSTLSEKAFGTM